MKVAASLGEHHTYVTDGPLFESRIRILEGNKILKGGCWCLDITGYEVVRKGELGGDEENL